jgi:hypothetical protein
VTDNNLNKKYFTEADSPVPLLPPDIAWSNMQQKLDAEKKRKRRFIFWWPPFIGVLLGVLLTGAAVLWWKHQNETFSVKTASNKSTQKAVTANTAPVRKEACNTTTVTEYPDLPARNELNKAPIANIKKAKNKKQTVRSRPILTENESEDRYPEKTNRLVMDKAMRNKTDKTLPFAFPERIRLTDTILVRANLPLPASFSRQPGLCDSSHKKSFWVEAGLQWNVPVTSNDHNYYLKGPNGNDQLYRLLLPGIWVSLNKKKHRLVGTLNPFLNAPLPEKVYDQSPAPGTLGQQADKQMVKMFGYQAGLQYGYQFTPHWWVGGGVEANWWKKGLTWARADSMASFLYTMHPNDEKKVADFQMSASVSTSYQFKAVEGFLQVSIPFNKTIKSIPSPIWIGIGIRWRLLNLKQKQQ